MSSTEIGVDGIANFAGQLQVEENRRLSEWSRAHGRSGQISWGEWERLDRTDPSVAMGLDHAVAPIRDSRVYVEPPEIPGGEEMAAFCEWVILERLEPGIHIVLEQEVRGKLRSGFSIHEKVWAEVQHPSLPGGRGVAIRKLAERLPSSLQTNAWKEDPVTGELAAIRQMGYRGGLYKQIELPADKVLLDTWSRNGNNYAGFPAIRPVYYLALIRAELAKLIAVALTREAAGIPIAQCEDKATALDAGMRADLEKVLRNLVYNEAAHIVMPPGWTLQWLYSPGANKGHVVDTYNALGLQILATLQAQQMMLGVNETGSRAVGEVHERSAEAFTQAVISSTEAAWNGVGDRVYTGILRDMVVANWGPQQAYPKLHIEPKRNSLTGVAKADAIAKAIAAQALTWTADDENALREELGLSVLTPEERAAAKAAAPKPQSAGSFGGPAPQVAPGPPTEPAPTQEPTP